MSMLKEFKEFAVKGNVIDLAVGIIIGAAFGRIVNSVVNDLIMPLIAGLVGAPDFTNAYVPLKDDIPENLPLAEAQAIGPVFAYGNFLTEVLNFLIIAFAIFLLVKGINKMKRKSPPPEVVAEIPQTEKLLAEIRDLLRTK